MPKIFLATGALEKSKEDMTISVPSMQDLLSAGVHFGHRVRRGHPKMKPFIFGVRDGVHIIDLAHSERKLKEATQAAHELGKNGGSLLIVGTKRQAKEIVKNLAEKVGAYYLTERWIGGLLTNFDEIRRNINKLTSLKEEQEKGLLSRYTKKEQLLITRKLAKFERVWGGIVGMNELPSAMFVIDAPSDYTGVREAIGIGIKVIGLCDTNADPNWFDYPIPANDDGIKSIKIVAETVISAYGEGKKELGIKNDELRMKKELEEEKKKAEDAVENEETAVLEEQIEKEVVNESKDRV